MQRGTIRGRESADASLREMLAHLNVIDAGIDTIGPSAGPDMSDATRDLLSRLELLAFLAARLKVPDVARVTDALEELVLASHMRPHRQGDDVSATMRHGVDVLMLLTHDAMRQIHGHPPAELRSATLALLDRVEQVIRACDAIKPPAVRAAGL